MKKTSGAVFCNKWADIRRNAIMSLRKGQPAETIAARAYTAILNLLREEQEHSEK